MIRRAFSAIIAVLAVMAALAVLQAPAQASPAAVGQDAGCNVTDYPPSGPVLEPGIAPQNPEAHLVPGQLGSVTFTGAQAGVVYSGTLYSTPVDIGSAQADANGRLVFSGFTVPSDFQLLVKHAVDLYRDGCLVATFDPCVNAAGRFAPDSECVTNPPKNGEQATGGNAGTKGPGAAGAKASGALPRTGWDHLLDVLKAAAVAFALGAMALYLRRRRTDSIARQAA